MTKDGVEEARMRHNRYAPPICAMVVASSHDQADQAMVLLESVIVGVLGHFFKGQERVASESLDMITEGAMRRLK